MQLYCTIKRSDSISSEKFPATAVGCRSQSRRGFAAGEHGWVYAIGIATAAAAMAAAAGPAGQPLMPRYGTPQAEENGLAMAYLARELTHRMPRLRLLPDRADANVRPKLRLA